MRISKLTLERYGPFEKLELPFDPLPGRLNVIIAPNGFGKSVIRAAIGDLLFGIPERTPMDFRYGTERMQILADVVLPDAALSLVRRKGRGNTLALADGAPVPPELLRQMLGNADAAVFRELFGLDTELLRSGGRELIRSQGRLGQVLFAAGGGLGRVRELLSKLEAQRDELGRATIRHKARPLWSALSDWEQASTDLRQAALRPDAWTRLDVASTQAAETLKVLLAEQESIAAERDRLQMTGAVRPWLARLRVADEMLADANQVPELDDGFAQRWRTALEAGAKTASFATAAEDALQRAQKLRAELSFDAAWLDAAEHFETLGELRGQALGAERDLPKVEADLAEARTKSTALRLALGWNATVPLPPAPTVQRARRHLQAYAKLQADKTAAETLRDNAQTHASETASALALLPGETDISAIADRARLLRADGDPAARLEQALRRVRTAQAAFAAALAGIPDNPLEEAALGQTAAPSDARLEATDKALSQAETAQTQAEREHTKRLRAIDDATAKLASLEQHAMLPPPDALAAARAQRDALWAAMCAPDPSQALAVDRAMRAADAVADALIAHGQEVAEAAALRRDLAKLQADLQRDDAAVTKATIAVAAVREELAAMARAAGGTAQDIPALRAFLRARAEAVSRRGERDNEASALADLKTDLTRRGGALATAMGLPAPPIEVLGMLLAEADRRIETARNLAAQRSELAKQATTQTRALALAQDAAEKAAQALADWHTQWSGLTQALSRAPDEAPDATGDALTQIEELRGHEKARDEAQRRVGDMTRAVHALSTVVASLAPLAPDLAALPATDAAAALQRRFQAEREQAARCAGADASIVEANEDLAEKSKAATDAARSLQGLRAALHAETDDAAEAQLRRAVEVGNARRDRIEAMQALARQGRGLGIEALAERTATTAEEADTLRLHAIESRQKALEAEIDAARNNATAAAQALDHASTSTDAADAAQRRQQAQALLARTAEEALVLHATHALLREALDRQAAGADQPLLARISTVFRDITGGVHAGVAIEETRAGQTMVALEADGVARKSLDQLSEGTCDQLYLALRIAALEDYAHAAPPLPLVADDVLQTSDDTRALAMLKMLLGLSAQVQVIALTHHPHIAAVAAELPPGLVHIQRLDG